MKDSYIEEFMGFLLGNPFLWIRSKVKCHLRVPRLHYSVATATRGKTTITTEIEKLPLQEKTLTNLVQKHFWASSSNISHFGRIKPTS